MTRLETAEALLGRWVEQRNTVNRYALALGASVAQPNSDLIQETLDFLTGSGCPHKTHESRFFQIELEICPTCKTVLSDVDKVVSDTLQFGGRGKGTFSLHTGLGG